MEILLVLQKIISIFIMVFVGFFAYKIKWLPKEAEKYLTLLMMNIAGTCLIIYSMQDQQTTPDTVFKAIQTLGFMCVVIIFTSLIAIPIVKMLKVQVSDRGVYRLMIVFTNCGFMGYPLAQAVFGPEGLFLAIVANMAFNIMLFSVGALLLIYDRETRMSLDTFKKIFSIPLVACIVGLFLFFLDIKFPPLLSDTLYSLGAMTAPLAMMIVGIQLAQSDFRIVIKNKKLLLVCGINLICVPAMLFLVFFKISFIDPLVFCVVIFAMCMPVAAFTSVLASRYGCNTILAAEGIFLSTLFSLLTIPFWGSFLNLYLNSL